MYRKGVNPLAAVFLASRNVTDIESAREVLGESPAKLCDPFLMADMDKAVLCINAAILSGERIAVYGDYDVDGMTSSALLALWLHSKGADYEIYIPGRLDEGYGINRTALDLLKAHGVGLVITVDCGITAIEEARYARELGLGLVITDHHECRENLPEADAVVDPKRFDCGYPYKGLAGVGVAFKLVCALEGGFATEDMLQKYGDLVAVGTIADVMPVGGENRELIRRGLMILNTAPRPGFRSLMREVNPEHGRITATTVSFMIAPRLNAAGRMGQPDLAVNLLRTDNSSEAEKLTERVCLLNTERRSLELGIYEKAAAMVPDSGPDGPILLSQRGWHQGVTGIVAAKMAERYLMPAIIISIDENGVGRGSCRSTGSFSIYDALKSCGDLLSNYGGHDMAAGVTVAEENIEELRRRITAHYNDKIQASTGPMLTVDFEVEKPELLSVENVEFLEYLEPFGAGFAAPCLCFRDALIISTYSIGAGKHTRLRIDKAGTGFDCIFFSVPSEDLGVSAGMLVDVAFEPQINDYRGRCSVQLHLYDIRMSVTQQDTESEALGEGKIR